MSPIVGLWSLRPRDLTSSSQSSSGRSSSEPAPLSATRATKCLTVEGGTPHSAVVVAALQHVRDLQAGPDGQRRQIEAIHVL